MKNILLKNLKEEFKNYYFIFNKVRLTRKTLEIYLTDSPVRD